MDWIWLLAFVLVMVLEFVGLRKRDDRWPTLTDVVRRQILKRGFGWAMAAFLGWIAWHWLIEGIPQ